MSSWFWSKISTPEPTNFQDIISEELTEVSPAEEAPECSPTTNLVAKAQEDTPGSTELDDLQITQNETNISISNTPMAFSDYDSEEETEDLGEWKDWDRFDTVQSKFLSKRGQSKRLRLRVKNEGPVAVKPTLESHTKLRLHKVISRELLERVSGIICIGKKAAVLPAGCRPSYPEGALPTDCALKVFNAVPAEFKRWGKCFGEDGHLKSQPGTRKVREAVHSWSENQRRNLYGMGALAARSYHPYHYLKNHSVGWSIIAENSVTAQEIGDMAMRNLNEYVLIYNQVAEAMKAVYRQPRLTQENLSEYTLLEYNKQCYFIVVHKRIYSRMMFAFAFLNDRTNATKFFRNEGVPRIVSFTKQSR